jgi:hypothetical protein
MATRVAHLWPPGMSLSQNAGHLGWDAADHVVGHPFLNSQRVERHLVLGKLHGGTDLGDQPPRQCLQANAGRLAAQQLRRHHTSGEERPSPAPGQHLPQHNDLLRWSGR